MVDLSPVLVGKIEKFNRLSWEKEILLLKLKKNCDEHRAIIYRCLIMRIEASISLITQCL
jgi:hypothetical protein